MLLKEVVSKAQGSDPYETASFFDKGANHVTDEKEADPKDKCQTS
jgi:hypothetical protein